MIVLDASAAVAAVSGEGPARELVGSERVCVPHLADIEIASVFRRQVASGRVSESAAWSALDTWRRLGVTRYGAGGSMDRIWELRAHLTAYDATYVSLAEVLECQLVTADSRLARAPGIRCIVTTVPA